MTMAAIAFFVTVTAEENEADFWQAGKYPLSAMHVRNVRQSAGEKILKRHTKAAAPNEPALSANGQEQRERKNEKKEPKKR